MARASRELFGDDLSWEGVDSSGGLDPILFRESARQSGVRVGPEDHASFRESYISRLREELATTANGVRRMPGVLELLDALRQRDDVVLGLLTGNYGPAAELKLDAAGIPSAWFRVTAFGDEADSRPALVPVALERYRELDGVALDPSRIVVIGDTPRDVECARANGCLAFAVATGYHSVDDLSDAGAHRAVDDLSDPARLYRFLGFE